MRVDKYNNVFLSNPIPISEQVWPEGSLPLVSITCITYNHEKYIRDVIEGFILQKTTFPVEIDIHDDASTDGTADVIREYELKYPQLFNPIYQKVNQYSRGNKPGYLNRKRAKGRYLAFCEGDDYWTDPLKLQKQISEMEKRPKCDLSFHPAIAKYESYNKKDRLIAKHAKGNKLFTPKEVILGGPTFCPTASLVIRKKAVDDVIKANLTFSFFNQVFGSLRGGALYIDDTMSVYRKMSKGSWNERSQKDPVMLFNHHKKFLKYLIKANLVTKNKYKKEFNVLIKKRIMDVLLNEDFDINERLSFYKKNKSHLDLKNFLIWKVVEMKNVITNIHL